MYCGSGILRNENIEKEGMIFIKISSKNMKKLLNMLAAVALFF